MANREQKNWLMALNGGNENGTKMAISVVLNQHSDVIGVSAMELYSNGTAMINYSIASKNADDYPTLVYAATKDMVAGIQELQVLGEIIHFVGNEHHLESLRAIASYYAVGQVPIDGPTSLLADDVKYYEVAYGDPKDVNNQAKIN
jgi:CO dehydrogenase/acetyl-CoA synthase gamma subunit (corrinoid Fe-S protein)